MATTPVRRYIGIAKEENYGEKKPARFHLSPRTIGLDSPVEPFLQYEGGLGRMPSRYVAGSYISSGALEFGADVSTLWYFLWLTLGILTSSKTGITDVDDEALGSTDGSGNLSGTTASNPVTYGSFNVSDTGPAIVAADDGLGKIWATTAVVDDGFATGASDTTLDDTLTNDKVVPGSVEVYVGVTLVAHDDGKGLIIEDAASGVTGTIDYQTGDFTLTGLTVSTTYDFDYSYRSGSAAIGTLNYITGAFAMTGLGASEAHTGDYSYGNYEHTITPQDCSSLPSNTTETGKDRYEQVFKGCSINSFALTVEREFVDISIDVLAADDERQTIKLRADLKLLPDYPVPFHKTQFKYADKDASLADISADIDMLSITINNNGDAEGGLGLNSRYPGIVYAGNLDIDMELTIKFESISHKQDFWGGPDGPTETPTEKRGQFIMDSGGYGSITCNIPRMLINSVPHQPSGRARLEQTLTLKALWHEGDQKIIEFICDTLAHWDVTYP